MKSFWSSIHWIKAIKIAVGAVVAILLAEALDLQNAASAGIITLLTIQNTRQETIAGSLRRIAAFSIMTLLCGCIYTLCGTAPWAFGITLLLLLLLCYGLHLEDASAINAVMATHYMFSGGVSFPMIGNEALLLIIGSGIGICLNWFMPKNLQRIQEKQAALDEEIRAILYRMSQRLMESDHTGYGEECFEKTDCLSKDLEQEVMTFIQNQAMRKDIYLMQYILMRREQCVILHEIYRHILKLTLIPTQAKPLSQLFEKIAAEYQEENDCTTLLIHLEQLHETYRSDALPESRESFENRAVLYCILTELRTFLQMKQRFYQNQTRG